MVFSSGGWFHHYCYKNNQKNAKTLLLAMGHPQIEEELPANNGHCVFVSKSNSLEGGIELLQAEEDVENYAKQIFFPNTFQKS